MSLSLSGSVSFHTFFLRPRVLFDLILTTCLLVYVSICSSCMGFSFIRVSGSSVNILRDLWVCLVGIVVTVAIAWGVPTPSLSLFAALSGHCCGWHFMCNYILLTAFSTKRLLNCPRVSSPAPHLPGCASRRKCQSVG